MTDSQTSDPDFTVEFVPSPVARVARAAADAPPPATNQPGWSRAIAIAATAPALVLPLGWLAASILWRFVVEVRSRIDADGNLESVPSAIGRTLSTFLGFLGRKLRPGTVIGWILWALGSVVAGTVVTAFVAGFYWIATEGDDGAFAAVRSGGLTYGIGAAAWFACTRVVRDGRPVGGTAGQGAPNGRTTPPVRQVITFAVVALVATTLTLTSRARTWWPSDHGGAFVMGLPAGLGSMASDLQDSRVLAQVEAVVGCVAEDSAAYGWSWGLSEADDDGEQVVAIDIDSGPSASRGDLAVLAVSLVNQLPSSIYEISIQRSRALPALVIDRRKLRRSWRPFRDSVAIAAASSVEPRFLPMSEESRGRASTCSVSAP